MIDFTTKAHYSYEDVLTIIHLLRSPEGCPWDQVQTHQSIRRNFLEETYEVCEAIDADDPAALCEELGDVLTQVVFHADIEQDAGRICLGDIYDSICKKMIRRHPHIFSNPGDPESNANISWDELKRREKGQKTQTETLQAVAKSLPALWRAEKLQNKAKKVGFAWADAHEAMDKLYEEVRELDQSLDQPENAREELGDVLFASVCVAYFSGIDPEEALHQACEKFIRRFSCVEKALLSQGRTIESSDREELLQLWKASR